MASLIRTAPSAAKRAVNLLRAIQSHPPSCPCHSNPGHHYQTPSIINQARRSLATPVDTSRQKEYAFEMAASSIRFGIGCTKEVGMDFKNMGAKRVCVVTDVNVAKLDAMKQVMEALSREGIEFTVFDKTRVEPKDYS
jgi:hydroxyacid-oxoacid transhydrogenase